MKADTVRPSSGLTVRTVTLSTPGTSTKTVGLSGLRAGRVGKGQEDLEFWSPPSLDDSSSGLEEALSMSLSC